MHRCFDDSLEFSHGPRVLARYDAEGRIRDTDLPLAA